ncbi:MAG: hypothetical protein CEN91_557, partial [Candidatus Berkelbacteria bacterium Licking1014_85]
MKIKYMDKQNKEKIERNWHL